MFEGVKMLVLNGLSGLRVLHRSKLIKHGYIELRKSCSPRNCPLVSQCHLYRLLTWCMKRAKIEAENTISNNKCTMTISGLLVIHLISAHRHTDYESIVVTWVICIDLGVIDLQLVAEQECHCTRTSYSMQPCNCKLKKVKVKVPLTAT